MHLRAQKFQLDVFGHLCALQSSCEHSECYQMVHCQYFLHFARPPSSETQFSMTKHDPRLVRKSPSLDACRAKRTIGADLHASPMCSKSLSLDARRWNCVSDMFKFIIVICSYLLSLDARRSKCASYVLKVSKRSHMEANLPWLWEGVLGREKKPDRDLGRKVSK